MGIFGELIRETREEFSLAKPPKWFSELLGGGINTAAGVAIDEVKALNLATVWACVLVISGDLARIPIKVGRKLDNDDREILTDHPAWWLLNREANPETTAVVFRETLQQHVMLWGNAFAEIELDGGGSPVALHQLPPPRVTPERDPRTRRIVYKVRRESGTTIDTLPAERMLHIIGLSYDGLVGYPVVRKARESMGLTMAAERFGASFFSRGTRPSGIITRKGQMTENAWAKFRKTFEESYSGSGNAGKVMLLEEDMQFQALQMPLDDAQFLETRKFSVEEICRWFRVPPHKVQHLDRATNANVTQQDLTYLGDSLGPWMVRWEQAGMAKLLSGPEKRGRRHFVAHNAMAALRTDPEARMRTHAIGRQWGWRSVNEIRRLEDENGIGAEGDVYLVPVNMQTPAMLKQAEEQGESGDANAPAPAAQAVDTGTGGGNGGTPGPADQGARAWGAVAAAVQPVLADAVARVLRLEADKARRASKQGSLEAWRAGFYSEHYDHVRSVLFPAAEAAAGAARAMGLQLPEDWTSGVVAFWARTHCEASARDLAGEQDIERTLAAWAGTRPATDAAAHARWLVSTGAATADVRK